MRKSVEALDEQFSTLHRQSCDLIDQLSPESLYRQPADSEASESCGAQVLRSAAIIEQTFGGITANLWDDPFEWTLPETLNTKARVLEYLAEVEATRRNAFERFTSDHDLTKEIMAPAGTRQLLPFLLDTLQRARHHQQRAAATCDRLREKSTTDI